MASNIWVRLMDSGIRDQVDGSSKIGTKLVDPGIRGARLVDPRIKGKVGEYSNTILYSIPS